MLKLQDIQTVHVELTTRCNARCPMCMRNYRGYDYNSGYPDVELTLPQIQHILPPEFLSQLGGSHLNTDAPLMGVNFNGNLGDFALARDGADIVEYVVSHGTTVNINTNGSLRTPAWWARMALPGVQIGFALDGLADTHGLYRQDTDWNRVIENAQAFISAGGRAIWRFAPFDHNRHQEEQCRQLAQELGFWRFDNIYDGRDTGPVYTRTGQYSHALGQSSGNPPPLKDMLESHIHWYHSSKDDIAQDRPDIVYSCRHYKNQEIYIAADGTVYPCCFLGFYPTQMNHAGNEQTRQLVMENNALEHSLEHCIQWFNAVEETWQKASIAQGRLYTCVTTCGQLPN